MTTIIINDAGPTDTDPFEVYVFGAMAGKPIRDRDLKVYFVATVICFPLALLGLAALVWHALR